MKKTILQLTILLMSYQISFSAMASDVREEYSVEIHGQIVNFNPKNNREIYFYKAGKQIKQCILNEQDADRFQLSHDKSAVITSDNGYIPVMDLMNCNNTKYLQEKKVKYATLADINLAKNIYVSIHIIETAPQFMCNATVAMIGSSKNLVRLPGADVSGWPQKKLRAAAFLCPEKSYISPDGKYVAARATDCNQLAYPGVWDIKKNKKVTFSSNDLTEKEIETKCNALFEDRSAGANQKQ